MSDGSKTIMSDGDKTIETRTEWVIRTPGGELMEGDSLNAALPPGSNREVWAASSKNRALDNARILNKRLVEYGIPPEHRFVVVERAVTTTTVNDYREVVIEADVPEDR